MRLTPAPVEPTTALGRPLLNVAHRGASVRAPENTLAAVREAVACGADLVEVDVQRSRDGALVVHHDQTLERTTDVRRVFPGRGPWRLGDFTHDELVRLEAGHDSRGEPQRIPTLHDVLDELAGGPAGLLLEVKAPALYPGIVGDLVAALRGRTERVVAQSFHVATMKDLKTRMPEVPVGVLGSPRPSHLPVLASWVDQVNPNVRAVAGAYIDRVHELGMQCLVWTVDRPQMMRRVVRAGADGVITNRPDVLSDLRRRRAVAGSW